MAIEHPEHLKPLNIIRLVGITFVVIELVYLTGCKDTTGTSVREIALKAEQENNELKSMMGAERSAYKALQEALKGQEESTKHVEKEFELYRGQFSIVDYQWMTNEVVTCHLALVDGQRSTNNGRWLVVWNARQKTWLQVDKE